MAFCFYKYSVDKSVLKMLRLPVYLSYTKNSAVGVFQVNSTVYSIDLLTELLIRNL